MSFKLVETASGALALFDAESGETMHPHGPALEAEALFVQPSRLRSRPNSLVFDVGMGAGTNALAALGAGAARVISFEITLAPIEFVLQHADAFPLDVPAVKAMLAGHHAKWELRLGDLPVELARCDAKANVVFWDPYSSRTQPLLWGVEIFKTLREKCGPHATVHTFSGATEVRAALLLAGFAVGRGPGAGKKQKRSTVGAVCFDDLAEPLTRDWLTGLRAQGLPIDAPSDAMERLHAVPQFR